MYISWQILLPNKAPHNVWPPAARCFDPYNVSSLEKRKVYPELGFVASAAQLERDLHFAEKPHCIKLQIIMIGILEARCFASCLCGAIKTAFWKRWDAGNNSLYADSRWGKVECAVVDWMISEGRSHPCKARFGSNHRLFEWFRPEHSAWKCPSQLKCASHYTKRAMGAGYSSP